MSAAPDRIAALYRQAEQESSLAKAQLIAESADRLRTLVQRDVSGAKLPVQFFRN